MQAQFPLCHGLPVIGEQLMKAMKQAETINAQAELKTLVADVSLEYYSEERGRLEKWLREHKEWEKLKVNRMARLLPLVERVLFRVGEQLLSFPNPTAPMSETQLSMRQ